MRLAVDRKAWTRRAQELCFAALGKLRDEGDDPGEVLRRSVQQGWKGIFKLPRKDPSTEPEPPRKYI